MASTPDTGGALTEQLKQIEANARTLQRVLGTPYPIGQTPKEVVWTLNKARLYHYVPQVPPERRHPVPLLLVFALMNRSSILDLRPGSSFVEYMLQRGYDVYLLDWGTPGPEDKALTFDDYVLNYLTRAVRKLKSVSGSDSFSLLGWCIGALITTLYAALRPDDGLRNLILLTAPLDFTNPDCGGFARQANDEYFDVEKVLAAYGNMPGEMLDYGAKALKPVENFVGNYLRLWDNLDDPKIVESWHAMNTWVNDLVPIAGGAYRQLIVDMYRNNRLMRGTLTLRGERVDLAQVRASVLNLVATEDHIVPPEQTVGVMERFGSADKTLLRIPGGHIGMMAGSPAYKRTWPQIDAWLEARSGQPGRP
ncbi:MAG TPA: alpha/beta fold hydrolase [Ktedonobacterales bacterium]|nr:alpha/beta fold hydrolase [Ktedonobacterales bacterium]